MGSTTNKPVISNLNTDLDLIVDMDPSPLAAEFDSRDFFVDVRPEENGLWYVLCEDSNDTEPEPNIARLLDAIESLSEESREIWQRCSKRESNVGPRERMSANGVRVVHCSSIIQVTGDAFDLLELSRCLAVSLPRRCPKEALQRDENVPFDALHATRSLPTLDRLRSGFWRGNAMSHRREGEARI